MNPKEILGYWFTEPVRSQWFKATPELDCEIRQRYHDLWLKARDGGLEDWAGTPEGTIALVIVLDQFPLNMFRGQAEGFSTEAASRDIAAGAIAAGFDRHLPDEQKAFLYLPFMHSEDLHDQDRSVELYENPRLKENLRFAHHHRDIIRRFGRFPHRNQILGRESTTKELAWLDSPEAFTG